MLSGSGKTTIFYQVCITVIGSVTENVPENAFSIDNFLSNIYFIYMLSSKSVLVIWFNNRSLLEKHKPMSEGTDGKLRQKTCYQVSTPTIALDHIY